MDSQSSGSVRRFNGDGPKASAEYKVWKKWAKAWMVGQTARGVPVEALGPILFTLLDGTAAAVLEDVDIEELNKTGGEKVLLNLLDKRYPEPDKQDQIGAVLDEAFSIRMTRSERTADYTGRVQAMFQKAERAEVKLPSIAKGYLVLRGMNLSIDRRAVVLAAANRN